MNGELDDPLTGRVIAAAIMVHKELGPGFLESIYEEAMAVALTEAALTFRSYLRATGGKRGLLINFSAPTLQVKRIGAEFRPKS